MALKRKREIRVMARPFNFKYDLPDVLQIERESFEFPWRPEDFKRFRFSPRHGLVVEHAEIIVGYVLYEVEESQVFIANLAVSPDYLRAGIGTQMIAFMRDKLAFWHLRRMIVKVRETNDPAIYFFRSCRFRAISVLRDHYDETRKAEDAYLMHFCLKQKTIPCFPKGVNRIANWIKMPG